MNGLIHVYTGDGKGKTTAALGLALRAAGCGQSVLIVQFFKGRDCGELHSLTHVPRIIVWRLEKDYGFYETMGERERAAVRSEHDALLTAVCERVAAKACDVLILDEVISAYNHGALDTQALDALIADKPDAMELVLTGRNAPRHFIDAADYVTVMQKGKHPWDLGISAREGIEF